MEKKTCCRSAAAAHAKKIMMSPLRQFFIFTAAAACAMMLNRGIGYTGGEWFIGAMVLLSYEVINPVCMVWTDKPVRYILLSILFFVLLFIMMPVCATAISAKSFKQIGPSAMVYLVVMYYPFSLSLGYFLWFVVRAYKR